MDEQINFSVLHSFRHRLHRGISKRIRTHISNDNDRRTGLGLFRGGRCDEREYFALPIRRITHHIVVASERGQLVKFNNVNNAFPPSVRVGSGVAFFHLVETVFALTVPHCMGGCVFGRHPHHVDLSRWGAFHRDVYLFGHVAKPKVVADAIGSTCLHQTINKQLAICFEKFIAILKDGAIFMSFTEHLADIDKERKGHIAHILQHFLCRSREGEAQVALL
mmetsp:Transcript_18308/g.45861  ORF Transcript_18308/g.45861 Transcript_18308/m.45861 type:complete len:221 (-) Transcript_18308:100-762(-)